MPPSKRFTRPLQPIRDGLNQAIGSSVDLETKLRVRHVVIANPKLLLQEFSPDLVE